MLKYKHWLRCALSTDVKSLLTTWRTETMGMPTVVIYSDGACDHQGIGGYAASLTCGDESIYLSGNEKNTTSQRMELKGVITALSHLNGDCNVVLFSDSQYVIHTLSKWIEKWKKHHWRKSDGTQVANQDLLEELYELRSHFRIRPVWVKGHNGNIGNEIVDSLAQYSRKMLSVYKK